MLESVLPGFYNTAGKRKHGVLLSAYRPEKLPGAWDHLKSAWRKKFSKAGLPGPLHLQAMSLGRRQRQVNMEDALPRPFEEYAGKSSARASGKLKGAEEDAEAR